MLHEPSELHVVQRWDVTQHPRPLGSDLQTDGPSRVHRMKPVLVDVIHHTLLLLPLRPRALCDLAESRPLARPSCAPRPNTQTPVAKLAPADRRKRAHLIFPTADTKASASPSVGLTAGHTCQQPTLCTRALTRAGVLSARCAVVSFLMTPPLPDRRRASADFSASSLRFSSGALVV